MSSNNQKCFFFKQNNLIAPTNSAKLFNFLLIKRQISYNILNNFTPGIIKTFIPNSSTKNLKNFKSFKKKIFLRLKEYFIFKMNFFIIFNILLEFNFLKFNFSLYKYEKKNYLYFVEKIFFSLSQFYLLLFLKYLFFSF
jgi:hypothetical protein